MYWGTSRTKRWITIDASTSNIRRYWDLYARVERLLFVWDLLATMHFLLSLIIITLIGIWLTNLMQVCLHMVAHRHWHTTWPSVSLSNLTTACRTIQHFNWSISERAQYWFGSWHLICLVLSIGGSLMNLLFLICDLIGRSYANAFVNSSFTSTKLTKENKPR